MIFPWRDDANLEAALGGEKCILMKCYLKWVIVDRRFTGPVTDPDDPPGSR